MNTKKKILTFGDVAKTNEREKIAFPTGEEGNKPAASCRKPNAFTELLEFIGTRESPGRIETAT